MFVKTLVWIGWLSLSVTVALARESPSTNGQQPREKIAGTWGGQNKPHDLIYGTRI